MRNLSIRARLWLLLVGLMALLLAIAAGLIFQLNASNARLADLYNNRMLPMQQIKTLSDGYGIKMVEIANKASNQQILPSQGAKSLEELQTVLNETWEAYSATTMSEEEKELHARADTSLKAVRPRLADLIRLLNDEDHDGLASFIEYRLYPSVMPLTRLLDEMSVLQQVEGEKTYAAAGERFRLVLLASVACTVVALVLAVIGGTLIIRAITRNLESAVRVAETVSEGDLTSHIDTTGRNDEIGRLMVALQRMNQNLQGLVGRIRESSESIATGASQISSGNNDLSQRTEEQASNLQQTAASMEQLASTVRNNTDNALQATNLAQDAARTASEGGEAMQRVTRTMESISASSHKISDIIGVIDGIAFQTNILALNAAVEAARAGEQGRGFAVVAAEVRSLAGRSAEAAKQIKLLIQESVEKVSEGTRLVSHTGATIEETVQQVQRVATLIQEISEASREQSLGTGQVSDAIAQLDQVTQQNAALVEESAAAAGSLNQQASELTRIIASFKTHATVTGYADATAQVEHHAPLQLQ